MPTIAPHIDIIFKTQTTNSTSFVPTDKSYGVVEFNLTNYDPWTEVWFEAVFEITYVSGVGTIDVQLYDETTGAAVSSGSLNNIVTTPGTYLLEGRTLVGAFGVCDLTNENVFGPRIKVSNAANTARLLAARLVVVQTGVISKTQIYIPVGYNDTHNSTTATEKQAKRFLIDPANWDGIIDFDYHVTMKTASGTGRAILRDLTGAADYAILDTIQTSPTYLKYSSSGILSWPTVSKEFTVQLKHTTGAVVVTLYNAYIVLNIIGTPSRLQIPLSIFQNVDATSTSLIPAEVNGAYHQYRSSEFSGYNLIPYFETVTKGAASTYQVRSILKSAETGLALNEVHDTAYVRKRTATFTRNPIDGEILKTALQLTAANTGTLSVARYIMQINFDIQSDVKFPFQILTKQIADASLPLEILKKLTADQTFPLENLTGVINPDATIVTDITTLRPNDFGAKQDLIPFPAPDNWLNASEISEDDDVSYNEGGNGASDLYGLDHHSVLDNKKIRQVQIFARVKGGATGNLGRIVYAIPAQSEQVYEMPYSFSLTIGYVNYSYLVQRNPVTSALFSAADIDDFQIGWKSETNSATASRVTQMWCVVTFELPL